MTSAWNRLLQRFFNAFSTLFRPHLFCFSPPKAAAAKFYKGCSDAIKPYWLCEDVEGYADAIIRSTCRPPLNVYYDCPH